MKRIGDILIANGWIEPSILQRALAKQNDSGHRLCSLLVLAGALDPDDAACALGEQHGVAAALQRHLSRRDESLARLLLPALARACVALPLGRMGSGEIIVCVRDPSPALETQLSRAMKQPIRLAVAPAHQLEALVLEAYGVEEAPDDANEFDVDLSTGPIMSLELDDNEPVEPQSDEALGDLGALELVDLDDTGVSKDESQTALPIGKQRPTTLPPTNIVTDAPSYRAPTAPVVDAPSYRASTPIVVDAPSQREPPGRAALSAAGIAIPRTQTPRSAPPRETFDDEGIAIPRTQTPMQSGLDAAGAAPGRAALAVARTQTPTEIAVPRTRTPERVQLADELVLSRTRTPARSALADAAARARDSLAATELAAAQAVVAAFELGTDDDAPAAAPRIEELPSPPARAPTANPAPRAPTGKTLVPALVTRLPAAAQPTPAPATAPMSLPPLAPPRVDGPRPPPAALAALQRASSAVSRVPNIPPRPIPSAPKAVARAPEEIAIGTQLPAATLAISTRLSDALAALIAAPTIDAVCEAVMAFGAKRWSSIMVLDVEGISATGRRGHGAQISDDLAQWIVMTLEEPSLLQAAFTVHEVATATPGGHGEVEIRLQQLLGLPRAPSAIAVTVDGKPVLMLAVGDPDGDDLKTAAADLERLAGGASAALTRLRGR